MARQTRSGSRQVELGYQHPVPTREEIVAAIEKAGQPQDLAELVRQFRARADKTKKALEKRLKTMVRDGQLIRNKGRQYCLIRNVDLVTGRVMAHRDGFGFLRPDDGSEDVYIPARDMRSLWDADRISVRVAPSKRGGLEGSLVEILERATGHVLGRFARKRGTNIVVPEGRPNSEILIARGDSGKATLGDIVQVEIIQHPTSRSRAVGTVSQIVGGVDQPGLETDVAILSYGLPFEWPESVETEVAGLNTEVSATAKKRREDLRGLPLITIDGADAKDFDDAVYCEARGEGWRLIVAIADVSHYVAPDSPLDHEALSRGTSVYFPGRVLPMLPEVLSNGLCSLRPNVDRLCLACEMKVSARGQVTEAGFFNAVMRSASCMTYRESWEFLEGRKVLKNKSIGVKNNLICLQNVYRAFAEQRRRRGAINFDLPETVIRLDEGGKINELHRSERLISHRIIEECMIAANVEAAKRLRKARIPGLYRVHDAPDEDKVKELRLFLQGFNLKSPPPRVSLQLRRSAV